MKIKNLSGFIKINKKLIENYLSLKKNLKKYLYNN